MTDSDRIAQLEQDIAFLARHIALHDSGHATAAEYEHLRAIGSRSPRWPRPSVITAPENETP
jgi:hypothetical protein